MRPVFMVNGVDYSALINKYKFSVQYEDREGDNGGMMRDGSTVLDILARKAVISLETNGLTGADLSAFISLLLENDFVLVTFTDPMRNASRTASFHATLGSSRIAMWKNNGIVWYDSTTITLTEK